MSPIIDIQKRLVEVGRIRMGKKSERGAPQKLETFRFTSRDQARLSEIAALYGGTVQPWAERPGEFEVVTGASQVPILLLPGQALSQWYEMWTGGGCQRRCDGVTDVIADGPCQCPPDPEQRNNDAKKGKACKPTTRLSVMLPDVPGLGVWRLESHGYYAAVELAATAGMLEQATAQGQVFPARLRVDQRAQVKDGKTSRYAVPVVDIDVRLPEALANVASPVAAIEAAAPGYQPLAALPSGVSVDDALEATARQAKPKTTSQRAAAPIGPTADFLTPGAIPVPDDEKIVEASTDATVAPAPAPTKPEPEQRTPTAADLGIPPNVPAKATDAQKKKLDVLVTKLRKAEKIQTIHLWRAMAKERAFDLNQMIELLGGNDENGELHWAPLRESLDRTEASLLIERLQGMEAGS